MATFITGATGYLGSYVVARLLQAHDARLSLLVRAKDRREAEQRLWKALQLHMPFAQFERYLRARVDVQLGDITLPRCGLGEREYARARRNAPIRSFTSRRRSIAGARACA